MIKMRKDRAGFTLVEIMIVVAIIIILAAIAIPNYIRSRVTANEATAITSLKTIAWGAITYRTANSVYPSNLSDLANADPPYIDSLLASGKKQGYNFTLTGSNESFVASAAPTAPSLTGVRTFFVDAYGVIRASSNGTADNTSAPIE